MHLVQILPAGPSVATGTTIAADALAAGYRRRGIEVSRILPSGTGVAGTVEVATDRPIRAVAAFAGSGDRLVAALDGLAPQVVEVWDRLVPPRVFRWGGRRGMYTCLVASDRLVDVVSETLPSWMMRRAALRIQASRLVASSSMVVVPSRRGLAEFAAEEPARLEVVPFGVDLDLFGPRFGHDTNPVELVFTGRLVPRTRPDLAIETLRCLRDRGVDASLTMIGSGPMQAELDVRSRGLPVRFLGQVSDRAGVAAVIRRAAVALAPCPGEPFGLSALEALACGTPVVVAAGSGAAELLATGSGVAVPPGPRGFAAAVQEILGWPPGGRRRMARRRAECFPWSSTVDRMVEIYSAGVSSPEVSSPSTGPAPEAGPGGTAGGTTGAVAGDGLIRSRVSG